MFSSFFIVFLLMPVGHFDTINLNNVTIITPNSFGKNETSNQSDPATTNLLKDIIPPLGGLVIAVVTAIVGLYTYINNSTLKKKDILKDIIYPLFEEYDSPKIKIAKDMLLNNARYRIGSVIYDSNKLSDILITDISKINVMHDSQKEIKLSFDNLLSFIVKLEYLYNVKILDSQDILFFKDIIKKIHSHNVILNYIQAKGIGITEKLNEIIINQDI